VPKLAGWPSQPVNVMGLTLCGKPLSHPQPCTQVLTDRMGEQLRHKHGCTCKSEAVHSHMIK
jgi:hypothetical protein